jgi:hypothetical protein
MRAAYRLLRAIDELRAEVLAPRASRATGDAGTHPVRRLDPTSPVGRAAAFVIADAPSRIQRKVRRYALGQFILWCEAEGLELVGLRFEDIEPQFSDWLRPRLKNWGEVKVHARKLVRTIAAGRELSDAAP